MNASFLKISAVGGPLVFLGVAYYVVGSGPMELPWFLIAAPIAFAAIGYLLVTWMSSRAKVRVTVDSKARKLLVGTSAGQSALRMADVAKAEFGAESGSEGSTVYRLEFVMKNGERVPATSVYFHTYALGDQAKAVAAINAAPGRKMI